MIFLLAGWPDSPSLMTRNKLVLNISIAYIFPLSSGLASPLLSLFSFFYDSILVLKICSPVSMFSKGSLN